MLIQVKHDIKPLEVRDEISRYQAGAWEADKF
jgi:hypothetical protein